MRYEIGLGYIEVPEGCNAESYFTDILGAKLRSMTRSMTIDAKESIFGSDKRFNISFTYDYDEKYAYVVRWFGYSYARFAEYVTLNDIKFYLRSLRECLDEIDTEDSNKVIIPASKKEY